MDDRDNAHVVDGTLDSPNGVQRLDQGEKDSLSTEREPHATRGWGGDGFVESLSGSPVNAESDSVAATLLGVPRVEMSDIVYEHERNAAAEETRSVVLFDLENTSDRPVRWRSTRTKFVGDDDYTYQPSRLSVDPAQLGPGCHTGQVEIEPGCRARMVTVVEGLPPEVQVAEVVQTLAPPHRTGKQRLVFPVASTSSTSLSSG